MLFDHIIKANIVAVTKMCAMVMPQMVERKKGIVINLSSLSAWMPAPTFAVYAASKVKIMELSKELHILLTVFRCFSCIIIIFMFFV